MTQPTQIDLTRTANVPVAEGIHVFTVSDYSEDEGDAGPYWLFTLACNTPGEEGKTARLFCSLSVQARWRLELFLDAVQAPTEGQVTAVQFIGRSLKGKIVHSTYEGRLQANIEEMWAVTDVTAAPATPSVTKVATAAPVVMQAEDTPVSVPAAQPMAPPPPPPTKIAATQTVALPADVLGASATPNLLEEEPLPPAAG